MYEGVQPTVSYITRFDEKSDLRITYLGRTDITRTSTVKAEETIFISDHGNTEGKLLDDTEYHTLIDIGARKSYMSKIYFLRCKSLHSLPQFISKTQRIQVGNGQYISVLFIIPVVIEIHSHRLKCSH